MVRSELEKVWNHKPLSFCGHVACWEHDDEHGLLARPGEPLKPMPGKSAMAFRRRIAEINTAFRGVKK
jgi:hypothetical protein